MEIPIDQTSKMPFVEFLEILSVIKNQNKKQ